MMSIKFITILAILSLLAYITVYYWKEVCYVGDVTASSTIVDTQNNSKKSFYPITFGSSFIVIDEKMISFD